MAARSLFLRNSIARASGFSLLAQQMLKDNVIRFEILTASQPPFSRC